MTEPDKLGYAKRRRELLEKYGTTDPATLRAKMVDLWDVVAADIIASAETPDRPRNEEHPMTDQTTTTAPTLDQLAPYPKRAEDATAEAIIRYALAQAQMGHTAMMEGPSWVEGPSPSRTEAAVTATVNWALAAALRELHDVAPRLADRLARRIWEGWDAGSTVGEQTWEWLAEMGIDPEQVSDAYRVRAARIALSGTTDGMLAQTAQDEATS